MADVSNLWAKLPAFVRTEPVRVAVHSLLLSSVAAAVASGKLTDSAGDIVVAAVVYVLFGAGAEFARAQVVPTVKL